MLTRLSGPLHFGSTPTASADGPHVYRHIVPVAALERAEPVLRGKLTPPAPSSAPASLSVRNESGRRAVTVNLHMGVPGDVGLDPSNESLEALRAVAAHVNALDPDIVFVQELRSRPAIGRPGLPEVPSIFAHLIGATDMAFTPAVEHDPRVRSELHYGTAIYTRRGSVITKAVNVALPNGAEEIEPRSLGVAEVQSPDGHRGTVMESHWANRHPDDAGLRRAQGRRTSEVKTRIDATGGFHYRDAIGYTRQKAEGFAPVELFAGDLNQQQAPTDAVLNPAGLTHVNELYEKTLEQDGSLSPAEIAERMAAVRKNTAFQAGGNMAGIDEFGHRIDLVYGATPSVKVNNVTVTDVPANGFDGYPTDHRLVTVDYE